LTGPAWNVDPPGTEALIAANAAVVLRSINAERARRPPVLAHVQEWHRQIYAGVPGVPVAYYLGEWRDSDPRFPFLIDYEVGVGTLPGVRARDVPAELERFEQRMQAAVGLVDGALVPGARPSTVGALADVVQLCAFAHGEWVRIHPFANGNGRTARLWANWVALRYGLPAFIRIKPRPDGLAYQAAAMASMLDRHGGTELLFHQLLREALGL
jgi:fido (protein-threonine AMPylation protein)